MRRVTNRLRPLILSGLLLALPLTDADAKNIKPDPNGLPPQDVKDLHYGDVLFYFFQDDYFDSITRLLAARQLERIPHTQGEAELLLGGLYLSLGEHVEAGRILGLVSTRLPGRIRARSTAGFGQNRSAHQRRALHAARAADDAAGAL